ncbi:MAG: alpha-L-rhamnosidase [Opitutus sp.]|nr:alpha-L-rhamnosidase [Opitutus sp.]
MLSNSRTSLRCNPSTRTSRENRAGRILNSAHKFKMQSSKPAHVLLPLTAGLAALFSALTYGATPPSAAVLDIGSRRELFVDGQLVDQLKGKARLRLHAPVPREAVMEHDAPWEGSATAYHSIFQDGKLYRMWELCRYSIKATTFAGVYVDGDRERIPYEADAYLNQLSHYATDHDPQMARDTYDHLMANGTWPTEWASHMIFMAHADWLQTGDTAWLAPRYVALKAKLLLERARSDGLIVSNAAQIKKGDLVDWPVTERDGFVFTPVNTVANAFYLRALTLMADLARVLRHDAAAADYTARERRARAAFQETLFDPARGVYRDGEGTDHAAQHSNLFPLAFGLVPEAERARVTTFVVARGMACSVYAAQYLLEGLFENGAADTAHALIVAPGDRSWKHMVESGTTITWEAWDQKYKPNQDWNHAWGAAPANLFPRYVLGARPLTPGWSRATIRPHPGPLGEAEGQIPTPRGPVMISWKNDATFRLTLTLPKGMTAQVELPAAEGSRGVVRDEKSVRAHRAGAWWILDEEVSGVTTFDVR